MKKISSIILILVSVNVFGQGFPSTDSLHRYNNRFVTNSAINSFTDYRLNTLLHGMINWIDTARLRPGGGSTNLNIGSGFRHAVPGTNNIKTNFAKSPLIYDSSSNTNAITIAADTTDATASALATQYDLSSKFYVLGRNLRKITGPPDSLATIDSLITADIPSGDSSSKVVNSASMRRAIAAIPTGGSGGSSAAGSTGDMQYKGSTGLLSTSPGSFFNIDSTNKKINIGNPSSTTGTINIDSGGVNVYRDKYYINGEAVIEQNSSANQTDLTTAAANTQTRIFASGNARMTITNTLTTISTASTNLTNDLQLGGVGLARWVTTDLRLGSVDAGFNTVSFYAAGSQKMQLDNSGRLGIGLNPSDSYLELKAGTSSIAALGLTSGTDLSSPAAGRFYFNGTRLGFSPSTTIKRFALTNDAAPSNGQIPIGNGTDYAAANITSTGGTLTVTNGSGTIDLSIPTSILNNANFTATITNGTNTAATTLNKARYIRVGNQVIVYVAVDIDPTSTGATEIGISLPVASALAGPYDLFGNGICQDFSDQSGIVQADFTNDRALFHFTASNTSNQHFYISFMYEVL